jgi:5-methylthioadenosine/S-adenosylhomocysteine deaminase
MPGLINAHTHSPMTLFRGLADDVDLQVFLNERVWPREVQLTGDEVYAGASLAALEMLHSGVTTYVDMYFWEEDLARAALDAGVRAVITPGILDVPAWEPLLGTWERRTRDVLEFCRQWDGREGRIHTGLGPHAPYTLPLEAMGEVAAAARAAGVLLHTHVLEAAWEREVYGGPVAALEARGFFDGLVLAAHSVWVGTGDIATYQRHRVGVAHCPQSNAKLGAGVAPLASMVAAGLHVGLGTDGAATNNNLDLWEELRLAPLLAKAQALDPTVVTASKALDLATREGAAAIGRRDIGSLEPDKRADVLVLRIDDSIMTPVFNANTYLGHLVYAAGRELVDAVWVNGFQVVKDGEVCTIDGERARYVAQQAADTISGRVSVS